MKICLVDNRAAGQLPEAATAYVAELGPALAEEHRVSIVTVEGGWRYLLQSRARIGRAIATDHPDIVHVNNLTGLALAGVILAISQQAPPFQPILTVGLHDHRLLRSSFLQRIVTRGAGLVVAPSSRLLDEHLVAGFFPGALHEVIPYGMPYHAVRLSEAYRRVIRNRRTGGLDRAA